MLKTAEYLYTAGTWEALEHAPDARLKLLVEPNEISWYAELPAFRQVVYHGHLPFHQIIGESVLKETMQTLVREQVSLRLPYQRVYLAAVSPGVLISKERAESDTSEKWLEIEDTNTAYQEITGVDETVWLYSYTTLRMQWLADLFPGIILRHAHPCRMRSYHDIPSEAGKIGLHVQGNTMEATVFDQANQLCLTTTFPFRTETDFVYFVLRLCDRFALPPAQCKIILSGQLDINSLIFKELYTFLGDITFIEAPFHGSLAGSSPHRHFGIYNLT